MAKGSDPLINYLLWPGKMGFLLVLWMWLNGCQETEQTVLMTVRGPVSKDHMGVILEHEHILVDFSGAVGYDPARWDRDSVISKVLPFVEEAASLGVSTLIDATPNYLGRDAGLLKRISEMTGMNILTNTGLYAAADHKYLPGYVFEKEPEELAQDWIHEFRLGIGNSRIKPGFIKISVNPGHLGAVEIKLVKAAAITHKVTGLTIASHTGPSIPAFEQLAIIKEYGVLPSAFVWIHAQNEKDWNECIRAAKMGTWVSFDGLNDENVKQYSDRLEFMKSHEVLDRVLISHDAGWYDPEKIGGGTFRPFNTVFNKLIPALKSNGFSDNELELIFKINPSEAFAVRVRI